MSITRPCAVCGVVITVASLKEETCGPSCDDLHARRQAARAAHVQPGHDFYEPITDVQRGLHNKAVRERNRTS